MAQDRVASLQQSIHQFAPNGNEHGFLDRHDCGSARLMIDQRDLPKHLILAHRADPLLYALDHDKNFNRACFDKVGAIASVADLEYLLAGGKNFTIQFIKHASSSDQAWIRMRQAAARFPSICNCLRDMVKKQ